MTTGQNATVFFAKLERVISKSRFDSYKQPGGTTADALCRYVWNTALCEALYPSFQILEVGFRNAVHSQISKCAHDAQWLTHNGNGFLFDDEKDAVLASKESLLRRTGSVTEDFLVAEMSFGFWTSLLDARYDTMWHKIISGVFPNMPRTIRTRKEASKLMNTVRKLRNAALHHHSVWHWKDLTHQHAQMHVLIAWICSSIAAMAAEIDRFPGVHKSGPDQFGKSVSAISN